MKVWHDKVTLLENKIIMMQNEKDNLKKECDNKASHTPRPDFNKVIIYLLKFN